MDGWKIVMMTHEVECGYYISGATYINSTGSRMISEYTINGPHPVREPMAPGPEQPPLEA